VSAQELLATVVTESAPAGVTINSTAALVAVSLPTKGRQLVPLVDADRCARAMDRAHRLSSRALRLLQATEAVLRVHQRMHETFPGNRTRTPTPAHAPQSGTSGVGVAAAPSMVPGAATVTATATTTAAAPSSREAAIASARQRLSTAVRRAEQSLLRRATAEVTRGLRARPLAPAQGGGAAGTAVASAGPATRGEGSGSRGGRAQSLSLPRPAAPRSPSVWLPGLRRGREGGPVQGQQVQGQASRGISSLSSLSGAPLVSVAMPEHPAAAEAPLWRDWPSWAGRSLCAEGFPAQPTWGDAMRAALRGEVDSVWVCWSDIYGRAMGKQRVGGMQMYTQTQT
jgi:hypothetical protein